MLSISEAIPNMSRIICATLADDGDGVIFRSYTAPNDAKEANSSSGVPTSNDFPTISILEAARATSAAPTYLPNVKVKDKNGKRGELSG
jgi:hypothetical protein